MTLQKYKTNSNGNTNTKIKGKYATSTENRKRIWELVIWPMILELDRNYFLMEEYRTKRDRICKTMNLPRSKVAGGLVSLMNKGILNQENDKKSYSIHYKLIPYMRKKYNLEYGTVLREISSKK